MSNTHKKKRSSKTRKKRDMRDTISLSKWKAVKPHTMTSRNKMKAKYGNKCFLVPNKMKYPICSKYSGKINCNGINAAEFYLNINIGRSLKKARSLMRSKTNMKEKESLKKELAKISKYNRIRKKLYTHKKNACKK